MVFDEATLKTESNLKEFVVSRDFRVIATNEAEARLILEQQLIDMAEAVVAVKHIAAALQLQALERAQGGELPALPPLQKPAAKDHGPN